MVLVPIPDISNLCFVLFFLFSLQGHCHHHLRSKLASQRINKVSSYTLTPMYLSPGLRKGVGACVWLGQTLQIQIVQEFKTGNMKEKERIQRAYHCMKWFFKFWFPFKSAITLRVCPRFVSCIISKVVILISGRDREMCTSFILTGTGVNNHQV